RCGAVLPRAQLSELNRRGVMMHSCHPERRAKGLLLDRTGDASLDAQHDSAARGALLFVVALLLSACGGTAPASPAPSSAAPASAKPAASASVVASAKPAASAAAASGAGT